jgi:hypothetical protein
MSRQLVRVVIVSNDFYTTQSLATMLRWALKDRVTVTTVFRTYHFDIASADIVIGNGLCKENDHSVYFPQARIQALTHGVPYFSIVKRFVGTRRYLTQVAERWLHRNLDDGTAPLAFTKTIKKVMKAVAKIEKRRNTSSPATA